MRPAFLRLGFVLMLVESVRRMIARGFHHSTKSSMKSLQLSLLPILLTAAAPAFACDLCGCYTPLSVQF